MQSTNDPRLLIGLGTVGEVERLVVRWPSGAVSEREHLAPDRAYEIVEPREAGSPSTGPPRGAAKTGADAAPIRARG